MLIHHIQDIFSDTKNTVCEVLNEIINKYQIINLLFTLTGSGAMSTAKVFGFTFLYKRLFLVKELLKNDIPKTDVVIEAWWRRC